MSSLSSAFAQAGTSPHLDENDVTGIVRLGFIIGAAAGASMLWRIWLSSEIVNRGCSRLRSALGTGAGGRCCVRLARLAVRGRGAEVGVLEVALGHRRGAVDR